MFCFVFNLRRHIDVWCNFAYEESWFRFTLVGDVILFISINCCYTFVFRLYSTANLVAHAMAKRVFKIKMGGFLNFKYN